ncbi:MAG: response regulator transcription factor [Bdellovibrionaceae bacterium]|nr:response regulator transcription factor [Pseudobdellovibrionaceae bacterium]
MSAANLSPGVLERTRILVVEDEEEIRNLIVLHLKREGHHVDAVGSVEEASALVRTSRYDLLALDWMLPGASGVEMARTVRHWNHDEQAGPPAILMVTARTEAADIVEGLEAGADDYLTKPFEPRVLIARVRALMRRHRPIATTSKLGETVVSLEAGSDLLFLGNLKIDTKAHEVRCGEQTLNLTPSEFKLLVALAKNKGRVLTRDSLISQVQGEGVSVVGRTVDTHVFGLRKKLGSCADVIETVRGVGYRVRGEMKDS